MKGTFFINPVEINVEIDGEEFQQGDKINGSIRIIAQENTQFKIDDFSVSLAQGENKKIKKKRYQFFQSS